MHDTISSVESSELVRLWRRRQALSPGEMGTMYRIVGDALRACNPPELHALGDGRQELVAQFLYAKVLRLDAEPAGTDTEEAADDGTLQTTARPNESPNGSAPTNAFALCAYFRRYLIDCTRSSARRYRVVIGDTLTESQFEARLGAYEDPDDALRDHDLDPARVAEAARKLIAGLDEPERLLLCEGFGQERPGGLSGVAARHAIASYHYRAGLLGLVHKRAGLPADYGKTTLGRWISQTLRIPILPENADAIRQVFQILGAEASYV